MISLILISINLWSYRILSLSPLTLFLVLAVAVMLTIPLKRYGLILVLLLIVLLGYLQISTTNPISILTTTIEEQQVQRVRLNEYPPIEWLPIAHWLEGRQEAVLVSKIQRNFFEMVDLNMYFFGNHPRPRSGVPEFEKFSYLLLPVFLIGLLNLGSIINKKVIIIISCLSLLLLSITGPKNDLGPFVVMPFFLVVILQGLKIIQRKTKYGHIILYILLAFTLAQQYAYVQF